MTDKRRKHIAARVRSYGIDQVLAAIEMAGQSVFLHSKPWATIDWVCENDDNISKILEGKYDNRSDTQQAPVMPEPVLEREDLSRRGVTDIMERLGLIASSGAIRADRWPEIRETSGLSAAKIAAIDAAVGFHA